MTTLYLIRHAEAEGNLYRIAQGQYNSILTDRGNLQVQALERRFADVPIDAVYSSDLYRTCATASAIYRPKKLQLHRRKELREICVGAWEQKTWGEIARMDLKNLDDFSYHLDRWHVDGAETPEQVRDRMLKAVREIAAENDGKTVAVFSHGCAIRILLATIQGISIADLGTTPHGDNTAVSKVEVDGETMRVVFRDDSSHLSDPRCTGGVNLQKRTGALEPGLYFEPLRLPEQAGLLEQMVSAVWTESGEVRNWNPQQLLDTAQERTTLVGYLPGERPVGIVQMLREPEEQRGWMSLFCIDPAQRKHGFGIQLLGQAVAHFRPLQGTALRIALPEHSPETVQNFFRDYGFSTVTVENGRAVLEKSIAYLPEFLGEDA